MILINTVTGIVNILSFMALLVTTDSPSGFLSALFLFASSIFLEALSIWTDKEKSNSRIIVITMLLLFSISILGACFSIAGLANFINVMLVPHNGCLRIMIASQPNSISVIPSTDITDLFLLCGYISLAAPFVLAIREYSVEKFRKKNYNLNEGLFGK